MTPPPELTPDPGALASRRPGAATAALTVAGGWQIEGLPATVRRAGPQAAERTVEFFTAQIRNPHTRAAYATAVTRFFAWCDARGLDLHQISPIAVATYIEALQNTASAPTVKQHLAAIRHLFDYWVVGQVVPTNPAAAVRGPTHVVRTGKTPVLQPEEARLLLASIDGPDLAGLRDRALIAVMVYSFARVSAVVRMEVEDYYQQGKRWWLRLQEKGGKHHALPVHHTAEAYLDTYLDAAGIADETGTPLWRTLTRGRALSGRRMSRVDVFRMIKRRGTRWASARRSIATPSARPASRRICSMEARSSARRPSPRMRARAPPNSTTGRWTKSPSRISRRSGFDAALRSPQDGIQTMVRC